MEQGERSDKRNIIKTQLVYMGGAWGFFEVINFLINKYDDFVMSFVSATRPTKEISRDHSFYGSNAEVGFYSSLPPLLGQQAIQEGRALTWYPMTKTIKAV